MTQGIEAKDLPVKTKGLGLALFVAAAVPYLLLVYKFWFLVDDAFITFRYAKHWADGAGLRFNPGESPPVEGFSNFSWTALMAAVHGMGLEMARLAPWISAALGFILLFLLFRLLWRDLSLETAPVLIGLLAAALSPAFAVWSTGGLETMAFAFLLFSCFYLLLAGNPRPLKAGILGGILALTRPEGILWVIGLGICHLVARPRRPARTIALFLGTALCFFLPYLVARWCYFGDPLPNTFYAKAPLSADTLLRGFDYTASYLLCFVTPLALLPAFPFLLTRKHPGPVRSSVLISLAFLVYATLAGGDFMAMGRFLAPSVPFFAVTAAYATQRFLLASRPGRRPLVLGAAALLCAVQVLPAFGLEPMPRGLRNLLHFRLNLGEALSELEIYRHQKQNLTDWTIIGRTLKRISKPGDSVVAAGIGAIGFYSDLHVHDCCGLVDLEVARRKADYPFPRSPGHDKFVDPEFFLRRKPTYLRIQLVPPGMKRKAMEAARGLLPPGYEARALPLGPKGPVMIFQRRIE